MTNRISTPLVSIGLPTFERPDNLKLALESLLDQTYKNLEIIVSDNCSKNDRVEKIIRECMEKEQRIKYYRQEKNIGAYNNFNFVLENAKGDYFMWAADDDLRENFFIERCIDEFAQNPDKYSLVGMEANYFDENGKFGFFPEGKHFYCHYSDNPYDRLVQALKYNFGNLLYGLFKKEFLFKDGKSILSITKQENSNEIFLILFVSQFGTVKVLPEIGLYKKTSRQIYEQARWERIGGRLPDSKGIKHYRNLPAIFFYHCRAYKMIYRTIDILDIKIIENIKLKRISFLILFRHFYFFLKKAKKAI